MEEGLEQNKSLFSIIMKVKSNAITNMIKQFFETIMENMNNKSDKHLTVNCLINLIELLELFSWENIKNNLSDIYKEDIINKEQINNQLDNINTNIIFPDENKKQLYELCAAIRKFISRYLSGKIGENINKSNVKLKQYLLYDEFWPQNFGYIEDKVNEVFGNLDIKVSQALKFYEYLGGDKLDENTLNEIIDKFKEKKSNNNIDIEEEKENESNEDEIYNEENIIEEQEGEKSSDSEKEQSFGDEENNDDDSVGY